MPTKLYGETKPKAMILEIDNITRNIADIRREILSLQGRWPTTAEAAEMNEIGDLADEMESKTRDLESDLKERGYENQAGD